MSFAGCSSSRSTFDLAALQRRLEQVESELSAPDLWDDQAAAQKLGQEAAQLRSKVEDITALQRDAEQAREMLTLLEAEPDPQLLAEVAAEVNALADRLDRREVERLFKHPYSSRPALVSLSAGAGGVDAQDWAEMLLQMYTKWASRRGYRVDVLEVTPGDEAGIKGATLVISGDNAYGWLRSEHGIHRLVRLSPYDSAHRRHTSFARVEVVPELDDVGEDMAIEDKNLRVDTYRASGAGGQHVNKTSSAVRLTHLPTGIVVAVQNERSQHQNRDVAMKILRSKLVALAEEQHLEHIQELKGEHVKAEWGSQVRSYVLQPYTQVKDHRTGFEVGNVQAVLDGDLDALMEAFLKAEVAGPTGDAAN